MQISCFFYDVINLHLYYIVENVENSVSQLFKILPKLSTNQNVWGCACTPAPSASTPMRSSPNCNGKDCLALLTTPYAVFSVIDRNIFEMTEKNKVILVRMSENIG